MTRKKILWVAAVTCAALIACLTTLTGLGDRLLTGYGNSSGDAPDGGRTEAWQNWDPSTWARQSDDFLNPVIDGLWDTGRMRDSATTDQPVAEDIGTESQGISDPEPAPVAAEPVPSSYRTNAPVVGKLFFDTPEGPSVCSGTVITDPARPGASDLVWTAGHCVHAGAEGGWFRNIVFVPSYNDEGAEGGPGEDAPDESVAPFGIWWADWAQTSEEWIAQGTATGGNGAPFDFAVLRVKRKGAESSASLEETVGAAARVTFGAPEAKDISTMGIWGYPAAAPFDGERMFTCRSRPGRLSIRADQPSLFRIGCTMTGGSSGGGWFTEDENGAPVLVSNTSIGPASQTWLAGPRLGPEAQQVYESVSGRAG
ncbi:hypothetical protein [Streptomyces sp. NPDC050804]|uniref:trypsin-like serine peptidase n=1 Tax=Streptomyces sp. NPDC050804 TaxID=3154745 RepID=UPI00342CEA21